MAATRRSRSRSTTRKAAPKEKEQKRVGHVLGQEELAEANKSKVARFSAKNFPSIVEIGVASIATATTVMVIASMVSFAFANFVIFHATPMVLAYYGVTTLYNQINSPGKEDVVVSGMAFLCLLFAHFSYAFGRKRVSHYYQAEHAALYAIACYTIMGMLGDPLACLSNMVVSWAYVMDNFALLSTTIGFGSGIVALVGHLVAPRIDDIVEKKGCEGRPKHVIN